MTEIGYVIQPREGIPDDVIVVNDNDDDDWRLGETGWSLVDAEALRGYVNKPGAWVSLTFGPLTVTAVREPHPDEVVHYRIPGDASPLTLCGEDVWDESTSVTERAGSSNCTGCRAAADEDEPTAPSPLLDLVQRYGDQLYACAVAGECEGRDEAAQHERQAKTLFDRIAAVVAQQPVQARDGLMTQVMAELSVERPEDVQPAIAGVREQLRLTQQDRHRDSARPAEVRADRDRIVAASDHLMGQLRADRDEARAEVERYQRLLKTQASNFSAAYNKLAEATPAQSDPLVLSLPTVPEGAVALVTSDDNGEVRFVPAARDKYDTAWRHTGDKSLSGLVYILETYGSVTVEMATPREPRTWPKLDGDPDGVMTVRGASGQVYRAGRGGWRSDGDSAWCDSFASLQNYDGPLTEVLDEPGGAR